MKHKLSSIWRRTGWESLEHSARTAVAATISLMVGELSAGLRKSVVETGGGSEAVALHHPVLPVADGLVG